VNEWPEAEVADSAGLWGEHQVTHPWRAPPHRGRPARPSASPARPSWLASWGQPVEGASSILHEAVSPPCSQPSLVVIFSPSLCQKLRSCTPCTLSGLYLLSFRGSVLA